MPCCQAKKQRFGTDSEVPRENSGSERSILRQKVATLFPRLRSGKVAPPQLKTKDVHNIDKTFYILVGKCLRFLRDCARKKWPLRATTGGVSSPILPFGMLLTCVYRFPDHEDKTKKGQSLKPCPVIWSLATALRSLASVALSSEPALPNLPRNPFA